MKTILFFIVTFSLFSCSTKQPEIKEKTLYPTNAVWAMFNGCFESVQNKHIRTFGVPGDSNVIGAYCNCSIDKLRNRYDYETIQKEFSEKRVEKMIEVSKECNEEMGLDKPKKVL